MSNHIRNCTVAVAFVFGISVSGAAMAECSGGYHTTAEKPSSTLIADTGSQTKIVKSGS